MRDLANSPIYQDSRKSRGEHREGTKQRESYQEKQKKHRKKATNTERLFRLVHINQKQFT